jgi:alpha-mannosidase
MPRYLPLTTERVRMLADSLAGLIYPESVPVSLGVCSTGDRVSFGEARRGPFRPVKLGARLGPRWSTHWLKLEGRVPAAWHGQEVHLRLVSVSEAMVYSPGGEPLQGLVTTNWGVNGNVFEDLRSRHRALPRARGGERVSFYAEVAVTGLFGFGVSGTSPEMTDPGSVGEIRQCCLERFDPLAFDLYHDVRCLDLLARQLPEGHHLRLRALSAANAIANALDAGDRSTWPAARRIAAAFFRDNAGARGFHVSAVGHAHIDTAWLWRTAETRRKCARTFAAQLRLMERYPEHVFACSQAQQLAWVKREYPSLYAQLRRRARLGQFVPCGGTWIEPDCNLPSGESLVRQFLLGQRFFEREFGRRCTEFWNPDVFGYSAALPQIMQGAGIRFFLTQKLSWNQFNKPASSTFLWEGLDGSRVLTHFPPADTYNGSAAPGELFASMERHKDAERSREAYYLFGYGDGGCGPTEGMLESLRRLRGLDGMPEVTIRPPAAFFSRLEKDVRDPLVWSGELYFEYHRATYTTQAAAKRDNRRAEELLHDVEFLASVAHAQAKAAYPSGTLQELWELTCLNQFHDILPGSSINEVYKDTAAEHARVLSGATLMRERALRSLGLGSRSKAGRTAVVNTLAFERREVVDTPAGPRLLSAPSLGYAVTDGAGEAPQAPVQWTQGRRITLSNGRIRADLDRSGRLVSLVDRASGRECLQPGARGNQFVLFEDKPIAHEAWDVEAYHLEKSTRPAGGRFLGASEQGPLRVRLDFEVELSDRSRVRMGVILCADSPYLEFDCHCLWQESQRFLKVEFPLALRSDHATYEVQFGHVRRPTHFNTSWDVARFEVCAHRWADLCEPDFGVAVLNDSKYGYSCLGGTLRLSLLRAPLFPDPHADRGEHRFRYAVMPHAGGPQAAGVSEVAAAFNQPLLVADRVSLPLCRCSFFSVDHPALRIDTVKKAEDSDDLIVRLYETRGTHAEGVLTCTLPVATVARSNLLEEPQRRIASKAGRIPVSLRPFELVTLKLTLRKARGQKTR